MPTVSGWMGGWLGLGGRSAPVTPVVEVVEEENHCVFFCCLFVCMFVG
jgi:hypothetical protein